MALQNIVGKVKIASDQHFLLFHNVLYLSLFQQYLCYSLQALSKAFFIKMLD